MKQNLTGLSKIPIKKKHRAAWKIKVIEKPLAKNGKCHDKCLAESLELQKCLRQLTHRVLEAQEDDRTKLSHELQDEIAQTLLGINVRLLTLKQESRGNTRGLKDEIASVQRLIVKSAKYLQRFALELAIHNDSNGDHFFPKHGKV